MVEAYWTGYIKDDYGLSLIEIYDSVVDGPYVYIYIRGSVADDIVDKDDLHKESNGRFYLTIEDFCKDDFLTVDEVWPK